MFTIKSLIIKFVTAQSELLRVFSRVERARSGELKCNDILWKWQKHGAGVLFTNMSNGVKVDAHKYIDKPDYIDAWRLSYYIESRGITEVLVNDETHSIENYRDLNMILDTFSETKFLSSVGDCHFKVSILSIVEECNR